MKFGRRGFFKSMLAAVGAVAVGKAVADEEPGFKPDLLVWPEPTDSLDHIRIADAKRTHLENSEFRKLTPETNLDHITLCPVCGDAGPHIVQGCMSEWYDLDGMILARKTCHLCNTSWDMPLKYADYEVRAI